MWMKTFKDLLLKSFPNLTESEINDFLPKKEILNSLKIVTHDEVVVQVYTVQKRPVIFDVRGRIFPTIFFLWKFPDIVYAFTTHRQVMNFIASGADLMLPGVVTPPIQPGISKYGNVSENDTVCVNLSSNKAAIAVGVASQSSSSMALANSRGKCVIIHHFYGDNLCTLEGMPVLPIPNLGPPPNGYNLRILMKIFLNLIAQEDVTLVEKRMKVKKMYQKIYSLKT
ncbi:hypothetical protein NQ314_017196 [Rhamnusium bicolor]|uniref:Uncharacterized protein n=1 Tax=Rhamnusium bicolor TaxID=1586634 RepID=A0AAV8WU80_9CUCU|nr:hypothetical protein NQ314_017196 [Rhamnusium bicolor]